MTECSVLELLGDHLMVLGASVHYQRCYVTTSGCGHVLANARRLEFGESVCLDIRPNQTDEWWCDFDDAAAEYRYSLLLSGTTLCVNHQYSETVTEYDLNDQNSLERLDEFFKNLIRTAT